MTLSQSRFSYLVEISQKMIQSIQVMVKNYRLFPALIKEEHDMIKAHTYTDRLESVMTAKVDAGVEIEQAFEDLGQLSQQLYVLWGDTECEGQAVHPGDLSNCITMLEGIHKSLQHRESDLAIGVLELQISRMKEVHSEFMTLMQEIKPSIELNRTVLTAVSQNYQSSTRALVEMCEQAQATYTSSGQQARPQTGTSTIFVKA